ncbi:hypothetical protein Tco_1253671 [Tanacetum coccineum]
MGILGHFTQRFSLFPIKHLSLLRSYGNLLLIHLEFEKLELDRQEDSNNESERLDLDGTGIGGLSLANPALHDLEGQWEKAKALPTYSGRSGTSQNACFENEVAINMLSTQSFYHRFQDYNASRYPIGGVLRAMSYGTIDQAIGGGGGGGFSNGSSRLNCSTIGGGA